MRITRVWFGPAPEGVAPPPQGSYFVEDGWEIEQLDDRTVRCSRMSDGAEEVHTVSGVPFEVAGPETKREITVSELDRINLPASHRKPSVQWLSGAPREALVDFIVEAPTNFSKGKGFIITGPEGCGKTSVAARLAIAARRANRSAFFIKIAELRQFVRDNIPFDQTTSVMERCREVDVLILDNLREEDLTMKPVDVTVLDGLIEARADWNRSTIITTRLSNSEFTSSFAGIAGHLGKRSPFLSLGSAAAHVVPTAQQSSATPKRWPGRKER